MNHRNSNYKLNRYNNNNNNSSYPAFRQDNQNRGGGDRGNYNQGGSGNNNNSNSNNNPNNYYNHQNPSGGNNYQSGSGNHSNYGGDNYQASERRGGDNRRGGGYGNKDRYASSGDNYHGSHGGSGANNHHGNGGYQNNNNGYNQGGYSGNNHSSGGSRGGYHHNDNRRQHNNNNNNNNNNNLNNQRGSGASGKMRGDRNYDRRRQDRNNNRSSGHYSGGNQGGSHHGGNHRNNAGGHHGGHGHHNNNHNNHHHQSSSNNQVQNFYNNNKGFNQQERKNLETFHIRVFHNWVKSVLIQKYGEIQRSIVKAENAKLPENYLYILDLACGKGGDHKKWLMHSHACFYIGVDIAMEALNQAYQRAIITLNEIKQNSRYHSNIKFGFFQKDCSCSSEDFWKHINAPPPSNAITAADNEGQAQEQRDEGNNDKNENKPINNEDQMDLENKKENEENNQEDGQSPKKDENNEKEQNKDKESYGKYMFDVVSCQMAMHYMHESEEKVRNFLDNCTRRLNDQGFLLLTFTDGNAVLDIMRNKGQPTPEGGTIYSSKHFSMKFDTPVEQIDLQQNPYGNKYGFYLQESVGSQVDGVIKYVPEYLVNVDLFIELAKEYSLEVKENNLLTDFYENNKTQFADLLKQMKVTYSQEEEQKDPFSWEVSHCYRAVVFQKVLAQPYRYQFDRSTRDKYLLKYPVQLNYSPKKKED